MSLLSLSTEASALKEKLEKFVAERCIPAEAEYEKHVAKFSGSARWSPDAVPPVIERLKSEARSLGLWNLFLPHRVPAHLLSGATGGEGGGAASALEPPAYLSNREYGVLCEVMGRSPLAPEACNCSAPDTGNMEVLLKHGSREQQARYLGPLLRGEIRSAFLMTEPDVASSDARNLEARLARTAGGPDGDGAAGYALSGRKWWSTGAMDPRCRVALVVARTDRPGGSGSGSGRAGSQTVVAVPLPHPGVECVRPLTVFGYDDAPHGHAEVRLTNVELDGSAVILGEGRGFEIAQSRLGPGRIHHCMRAVGLAARCYELMLQRTFQRKAFGRHLHEHGSVREAIADSASDLEAARLLTLACADEIDRRGARGARDKIALIKVTVPELTSRVVDRAVQVFGGAGVSGDFILARASAGLRTLRIADGPDAVHKRTLALLELKKARKQAQSRL